MSPPCMIWLYKQFFSIQGGGSDLSYDGRICSALPRRIQRILDFKENQEKDTESEIDRYVDRIRIEGSEPQSKIHRKKELCREGFLFLPCNN
jgi:hypothetical protein